MKILFYSKEHEITFSIIQILKNTTKWMIDISEEILSNNFYDIIFIDFINFMNELSMIKEKHKKSILISYGIEDHLWKLSLHHQLFWHLCDLHLETQMKHMLLCLNDSLKNIRSICINQSKNIYIPIHEIIYLMKDGNKVIIYTIKEQYETYLTIKQLLNELDDTFIKVNSGIVVRKSAVKEIDDTQQEIILYTGIRIPISRSGKRMIKEFETR